MVHCFFYRKIMKKVIARTSKGIWFITHTNEDYELFDNISELSNDKNKIITLFFYSNYFNSFEPYDGKPYSKEWLKEIKEIIKKEMNDYEE